ncbi:MAG: choice-of-anchor Q domain-containing protein [Dokdonella sp.]
MRTSINRVSIHPLCAALASAWMATASAASPGAPFGSILTETRAVLGSSPPATTWVPEGGPTVAVTSCADAGAGSLRAIVAAAVEHETIDVSHCSGSTITLTSGEIAVPVDSLLITGTPVLQAPALVDAAAPAAMVQPAPIIDGNGSSRIFEHASSGGEFYLVDLTLRNGSVDGPGGCILAEGNLGILAATISGCTSHATTFGASIGGAVLATGSLVLKDSTISGNTAVGDASVHGGGLAVSGALTMIRSTIANNTVNATSGVFGFGGGLYAGTSVFMTYSTISGNHANDIGGAELVGANGAPLLIMSSTISGNSAAGVGGLLALQAPLAMASTTIAFNTATAASGVGGLALGNPSTLQSTLIAHNLSASVASDIASHCGISTCTLTVSGANNLIMSSMNLVLPVDTIASEPVLLPLGLYGGSTRTHALASTSPAIDHGNTIGAGNGSPTEDQRGAGYARVVGASADIGAFEVGAGPDRIFGDGFENCEALLEIVCRPADEE